MTSAFKRLELCFTLQNNFIIANRWYFRPNRAPLPQFCRCFTSEGSLNDYIQICLPISKALLLCNPSKADCDCLFTSPFSCDQHGAELLRWMPCILQNFTVSRMIVLGYCGKYSFTHVLSFLSRNDSDSISCKMFLLWQKCVSKDQLIAHGAIWTECYALECCEI